MNISRCTTVDFETESIESRPAYPPKPVGVAIRWPDGKREYLAWGHPTENSCTIGEAYEKLRRAWNCPDGVLFHNAIFDMDVAECTFGLRMPKVFHDTLYMSFLINPYEPTLSLKPLAEKYLNMPAQERDAVKDWILASVKGATDKKWGAHIAKAPGRLVGKYAIGDVVRTYKLALYFYKRICDEGMREAYEREIAVTPITLEMERSGVRLDMHACRRAKSAFEGMHQLLTRRIHKSLGVAKGEAINADFNLNSGKQLGEALVRSGKLKAVVYTKRGDVSTSIANLRTQCTDQKLLQDLSMYSVVEKYLSTFFEPWLAQASKTGGRLLPRFNQVRNRVDDGGGGGARSGRYSSADPNMQTVSANPEESQNRDTLMAMQKVLKDEFDLVFRGLRDFIIPDEGMLLVSADYNQQELRIFAHYENDVLLRAYNEDPRMDIHEFCRQLVYKATGVLYERKHIKITVFGIIYGMGIAKLAERLGVDLKTAKCVRDGIMAAVPGISRLMRHLKRLAARNEPLVTWGGRRYYCEEPRFNEETGQWRTFEYKMLNYQIQPSAADCTKQGMLYVHRDVPDARIALQVHDELVCIVPSVEAGRAVADAMCRVDFRVPMLADIKYSRKSWARVSNPK